MACKAEYTPAAGAGECATLVGDTTSVTGTATAAGGFNVVVMAKYFGTFPTIDEAKAVALKAAADLQGEWSYTASRQRPMRRLAWAK
jgi:hypothetical protein